jgi:hypothetical protein
MLLYLNNGSQSWSFLILSSDGSATFWLHQHQHQVIYSTGEFAQERVHVFLWICLDTAPEVGLTKIWSRNPVMKTVRYDSIVQSEWYVILDTAKILTWIMFQNHKKWDLRPNKGVKTVRVSQSFAFHIGWVEKISRMYHTWWHTDNWHLARP